MLRRCGPALPTMRVMRLPLVDRPVRRPAVLSRVAWLLGLALAGAAAQAQPEPPRQTPAVDAARDWQLVGRLGLAIYVIVPAAAAANRDYHNAIIDQLCPVTQACFLRFFTNSQGRDASLPLADDIEREPTAIFQRSPKYQRQEFRWSCRLKLPDANCF